MCFRSVAQECGAGGSACDFERLSSLPVRRHECRRSTQKCVRHKIGRPSLGGRGNMRVYER